MDLSNFALNDDAYYYTRNRKFQDQSFWFQNSSNEINFLRFYLRCRIHWYTGAVVGSMMRKQKDNFEQPIADWWENRWEKNGKNLVDNEIKLLHETFWIERLWMETKKKMKKKKKNKWTGNQQKASVFFFRYFAQTVHRHLRPSEISTVCLHWVVCFFLLLLFFIINIVIFPLDSFFIRVFFLIMVYVSSRISSALL